MNLIPRPENPNVYPDPFVEAAMTDETFTGLLHEKARIEYLLVILEEQRHLGHLARLPESMLEQHDKLREELADREGLLRDIWHEVRGDEQAFYLRSEAVDLQRLAETSDDPDVRANALVDFRAVQRELDNYLFGRNNEPEQ